MIDPNWPRWIKASIYKHFETVLQSTGPFLFVEGEDRQTDDKQDYCELRFDGPDTNPLSPNLYKVYIRINALVVHKKSFKNIYIIDTNIGYVLTAFTNIQVNRLGTNQQDDQSEVGCLKLCPDVTKELIKITRFGQRNPAIKLEEATLEACYEMLIDT